MGKKYVVGIEDASYTKDNRPIIAVRLHMVEELPNGDGYRAFNEFLMNQIKSNFHTGEIIAVLYEPGYNGRAVCKGVLYAPEVPKDIPKDGVSKDIPKESEVKK